MSEKKPRCLAYLPKNKNGDGGRCKLGIGHNGDHCTTGASEWMEFDDSQAKWLHPNINGKSEEQGE